MSCNNRDLEMTARRAENWLCSQALPQWSTRGFDAETGFFEEQLTFTGEPVRTVPRRVMVQSRQISVYAAAALSGRSVNGRELALGTMRRTIAAYHATDGQPGWVFSIDRAGRPVDSKRDLYSHAFVLFALAWVMRLERAPEFEEAIEATLAFLDKAFVDPANGGLWDCLPRPDALRRQNPHMHLFEAYIALFETTGRADVLERGRRLRDLAVQRFIDLETGALREYFLDDWRVYPAPGKGSVEPGHLFEWAWLLRRWQTASGEDQSAVVERLIALAISAGLDVERGRIVDEIGENGSLRRATSRSWPHAEALKSLMTEAAINRHPPDPSAAAILSRLLEVYCRPDLGGGWIDHVDSEDRALASVMPASTLYHLYFGIDALSN